MRLQLVNASQPALAGLGLQAIVDGTVRPLVTDPDAGENVHHVDIPGCVAQPVTIAVQTSAGLQAVAMATVDPAGVPDARIVLPSLARVRLRAVDQADRPIAGVTIRPVPVSAPSEESSDRLPLPSLTSPAQGDVLFLAPPGEYRLLPFTRITLREVRVNGNALDPTAPVPISEGGNELIVVTGEVEIVHGEVVGKEGQPLEAIGIDVYGAADGGLECPLCATTDREGRFSLPLSSLPATIAPDGSRGAIEVFEPDRVTITDVPPDRPVRFVGREPSDGDRLVLTFVDRATRDPVAGIPIMWVRACDEGTPTIGLTMGTSDPGGRVSILCRDGCSVRLRVEGTPEGYLPLDEWLEFAECPDTRDVPLERGLRVEGFVEAPEDSRLEVRRLALVSPSGALAARATLDAHGRFVMNGIRPGRYELRTSRRNCGEGRACRWTVEITGLSRGESDGTRLDLRNVDPSRTVRLEARLVRGTRLCFRPVIRSPSGIEDPPPVPVVALRSPGDDSGSATRADVNATDAGCLGPLPPGSYYLRFGGARSGYRETWWPGVPDPALAVPVDLAEADGIDMGPIQMLPVGRLRVLLPGRAPPESAAHWRAELRPAAGSADGDESAVHLDGRLECERDRYQVILADVPVGEWRIVVLADNRDGEVMARWSVTRETTVLLGKEQVVEVSPSSQVEPPDADDRGRSGSGPSSPSAPPADR